MHSTAIEHRGVNANACLCYKMTCRGQLIEHDSGLSFPDKVWYHFPDHGEMKKARLAWAKPE